MDREGKHLKNFKLNYQCSDWNKNSDLDLDTQLVDRGIKINK